jgi:hypothetical protein
MVPAEVSDDRGKKDAAGEIKGTAQQLSRY